MRDHSRLVEPEDGGASGEQMRAARRQLLGDDMVDDPRSPVASAARSAFHLGWDAALSVVATPADVTREPTGGQGLRKPIRVALLNVLIRHQPDNGALAQEAADAVLALPELAALLADADNWRRATTGDPTQPEPLAMQARTLLARVRELEATVTRVRELAEEYERRAALDADPSCLDARINQMAAARLRRTLTGEPQP